MDECYVTAVISPKAGMADTLKAEILANMPVVRKEQGCLRYDLHVLAQDGGAVMPKDGGAVMPKDGGAVMTKDGGAFLFYEIWADKAALDAHAKSPHMVAYRERTKDMLAAPTRVDVWSAVNVR
jgi:quinol monooxygenase YgiN